MSNDFTISEFIIDKSEPITIEIADKILVHHIHIIQPIRDEMECPIWASEKSGYRSPKWEKNHGRSGTSEHCFKDKGAVDYTCNLPRLRELFDLLKQSNYMRVCLYPTFIHADHYGLTKQQFKCDGGSEPWVSV